MRARPLTSAGLFTMSRSAWATATLIPSRCGAVRRPRSGTWIIVRHGPPGAAEASMVARRVLPWLNIQPRTMNGDTPHAEAARRIEMISSGSLTGRTLAAKWLHVVCNP
jgi:hypothetical protein